MDKIKNSSFKDWFRRSAPWIIILFAIVVLSIFTIVLWFAGPKLVTQKYDLHFYFTKGMNKYDEKDLFKKVSDFFVVNNNFYFPSSNSDISYSEANNAINKFPETGILSNEEVSKYTVDWGYYKSDGNAINEWFGDVYSRNLIYDTLSATFINSILDRDSSSSVFLFYSNKTDDPDEYTNGLKKYKVHRTINSLIEDRNHALKSSAYRSIYVFCNPPLSETPKTDTVIPVVETKTETPYQYVANPYFAPKTTGIMTPVTTTTGNYSLKVEMSEEGSFFTWSGFPDNSGYSYDVSLQYTDGNGMNIELLPPTECNDCKEKYDDAIKNRKIVINDFIEKRLQNIGIIFYATVNANNNSGVVASKEYRFNVKHGRTTCLFVLK